MNIKKLSSLNRKYSEVEKYFTIEIKDLNEQTKDTILKILETASSIGNVGHSYEIEFDREMEEGYKENGTEIPKVGWDGDGSDRLKMEEQVTIDGEPYKESSK